MKKLILIPAAIVFIPQALWAGFFLLASAIVTPVGDGATVFRAAYAIIGGIGLIIQCIAAGGWLFEEAPKYELRMERLRREREEEMRRLDAEIGIPRIPVRK